MLLKYKNRIKNNAAKATKSYFTPLIIKLKNKKIASKRSYNLIKITIKNSL